MRHRKSGRRLGRKSNHRKSMFCNMSNSLIRHELIKTTLSKAKELRKFVEPIITMSKIDNISNRRLVFSYLKDKTTIHKLFREIGPKFLHQSGGYTRILKCGFRVGDNASMAYVELIHRDRKRSKEKSNIVGSK